MNLPLRKMHSIVIPWSDANYLILKAKKNVSLMKYKSDDNRSIEKKEIDLGDSYISEFAVFLKFKNIYNTTKPAFKSDPSGDDKGWDFVINNLKVDVKSSNQNLLIPVNYRARIYILCDVIYGEKCVCEIIGGIDMSKTNIDNLDYYVKKIKDKFSIPRYQLIDVYEIFKTGYSGFFLLE